MKRLLWLIVVGLTLVETVFGQLTQSSEEIEIPQLQPKKWAICIGVSNYTSLGKLKYGAKDCISFANTLKTELGFTEDSVSVLADQEGYQNANAETVKKALDSILSRATLDSGDLFIVYFSGHGMGLSDGDYWMPNDSTVANAHEKGISVEGILERLAKKKLRNVVVVSDACRAGEQNPFGRKLIDLGKKTNIGILLGCAPGMKSYEAPKLGQGTFTYFLNRAIQKKSAVDTAIGAMLLSKLGEGVAKNVEEYTRHDYGDNAQKPSIYAEKEQEVVLGTFAPKKEELSQFLKSFKQMLGVGTLSPQQYKDALCMQASDLVIARRQEDGLGILRVLQSYGELTPVALYYYVRTCQSLGLSYELNSVIQKNNLDDPDSIYDDMAVIYGRVGTVGEVRYIKAIWNLYDSDSRDSIPLTFFDGMFQHLANPLAQRQRFLIRVSKDYSSDPLALAFAALLKSSLEPTNPDLEPAYAKLEQLDIHHQYTDGACRIMYRTYLDRRDFINSMKAVEVGRKNSPDSTYWETRSLVLAAVTRDPKLIEKAKQVLATTKNGEVLLSLILVLRADALVLEADFKAAAERLPTLVEAQIAHWISKTAKNIGKFEPVPEEIIKMSKGHLQACKLAYSGLNQLLDSISIDEKHRGRDLAAARRKMANDMAMDFADIGEDPDLVLLLSRLLNHSDQSYRLVMLAASGPWINLEDRLVTSRAEYLKELYLGMLNNGMNRGTAPILAKLEKFGEVDRNILFRMTLDSLLNSDTETASKSNLTGLDSSFYDLLSIHLALIKGDKNAVDNFMKSLNPKFIISDGILFYLRYLEYVSRNDNVPSEQLLVALLEPQPLYHDLWSTALKCVFGRCAAKKTSQEKNVAEGLPFWAVSESLNGNFSEFGYNPKSDIADYVGHYGFDGYLSVTGAATDGTLTFDIDESGKFTGVIVIPGEKEKITMSGTINGFGRIYLDVNWAGKPTEGFFAVMPHKLYSETDGASLPNLQMLMETNSPYRMGFVTTAKLKVAPSLRSTTKTPD
jgi:hypothetical protein